MSNVELVPVRPDDARELARLMKPYDVWRNLEYTEAPAALLVRVALKRADHAALFIRTPEHAAPVGFFLLYGLVEPHASVEFDVAITDPTLRRGGRARAAILAFEEFMLGAGRCRELWAWIDAANRPCLELVRTCGWPVVAQHPRAKTMVDGVVDVVEVRLNVDQWRTLKSQRTNA